MSGLKTIPIFTEDVIKGTKYMRDKKGRLDLMGQILETGYGIKVHDGIETPAHQNTVVFPFSQQIRGRANNTALCMKILKNGDKYTGLKQLQEANKVLEEYDIYLEPVR